MRKRAVSRTKTFTNSLFGLWYHWIGSGSKQHKKRRGKLVLMGPSDAAGTINWVKLDLGATAPPHDGNHSTCGYLGVIWTPWRDSKSQIGLIPLSLCRERRSKKVTHFRLYGNVRTWHGQIQELKGGFNSGYGGHWATDGKPNSPSWLPYTTTTMRVH